jgi:hypothetical protein
MTPGVLALETSTVSGAATYPMKETVRPSGERLSASSDLDEKLVTSSLGATGMVTIGMPPGVISAR